MGANRDFIAKRSGSKTVHGHKRKGLMTPEYRAWLSLRRRCYDKGCKDYPNWGGRGITVCEEWNGSFVVFLSDMGPRPSRLHSIDRIDPNGQYAPNNCRWATAREQGETKRSNNAVTADGQYFTSVAEAARHFGVRVTTAHERIKAGIRPELAVSLPPGMKPRRSKESYLRKAAR